MKTLIEKIKKLFFNEKPNMIHLRIDVERPICNCKSIDLIWGCLKGELMIQCKNCNASLSTGNQLRATVNFKIAYPDGFGSTKAPIISLVKNKEEAK